MCGLVKLDSVNVGGCGLAHDAGYLRSTIIGVVLIKYRNLTKHKNLNLIYKLFTDKWL